MTTICVRIKWKWRHVCDSAYRAVQASRVFLRAFGLSILTVVRRQEPPKTLIYPSVWQAMLHSVTHILPIMVSITVIAFNFIRFFIGRELQGQQGLDGLKLGVIQIAAKVQVLALSGGVQK